MSSYAYKNKVHRETKAKKILAILKEEVNVEESSLLDIGTGSGHIASFLSDYCSNIVSVDLSDQRVVSQGYEFVEIKSEKLPFDNDSFDVVISNQVIEHIPNQELHVSEIFRILSPRGIVYSATPNKYWPRETHTGLYFLGYLPRGIANAYMQWRRGNDWDVYPLSYWELKSFFNTRGKVRDYTTKVLKNPEKFHLIEHRNITTVVKYFPEMILKFLTPFLPSFIILVENSEPKRDNKRIEPTP